MSIPVEMMLKVSLVLVLGLLAMGVLRRHSAATRHRVLAVAFGCAAIIPLLSAALPAWQVHLDAPAAVRSGNGVFTPAAPVGTEQVEVFTSIREASVAADAKTNLMNWLWLLWLLGIVCCAATLVAGWARLGWLASRSTPIREGPWFDASRAMAAHHGLSRPVRLLHSAHPTLLVTWGVLAPKVLLPAGALGWPSERIAIVLGHELAHVRRRDWIVQMAVQALASAHWFNPLIWIACRRLRHESEQACDDEVLAFGVAGRTYAVQLLDLARSLRAERRAWTPAPAIARPSSLERRVEAMLNGKINRDPLTRTVSVAAVVFFLAITLPVARFEASGQAFSTVSGTVVDPQGGLLPGATMTLVRRANDAKYEIRTDAVGRFEFVGLPPGDYVLEGVLPGFKKLQDTLAVSGDSLIRNVTFQVGTLQETITIRGGPPAARRAPQPDVPTPEELRRGFEQALARCDPSSAGPAIGGKLRPPRKISHVSPLYPEGLRAAGIGGTVSLDATIGVDGRVREVRAADDQSVDPGLVAAAIDAVRQWEFDGTLLNCVPVEVVMIATVSFTPEQP